MEDYRSPKSYRIPYLHSLKGSLVLSLTTEPRLSHGGDFLSIYSGAPTRAHVDSGAPRGGEGEEEGTFGAGTLSSHSLLSQVDGLSPGYFWWISQPNGAVREIHDPGGES